jgi:hypothetical protein
MRKLLLFGLLFTSTAYAKPEYHWWRYVAFGIPLVECRLVDRRVEKCHFLTAEPHPLDAVMESFHRILDHQEP